MAAEILAAHEYLPIAAASAVLDAQVGYATPKVDVRGAVFHEGRVLLVRERSDRKWSLPGGFADVTESPAEAVVREVWEEAGVRARATKLLAVLDYDRHGHPPYAFRMYKLFFRCEALALGEHVGNAETLEAGFFAEEDVPELSTLRTTPAEIARMFAHLRAPDAPTDFD